MKDFRFYLDQSEKKDPRGWNESQKKLVRHPKYRGVFTEFIADAVFSDDGYDYLKSLIDTNGFCGEVDVDIHRREGSNYVLYFEGIIKLSEVVVNESRCTITCNIEDRNLTSLVENLGNIKVKFNRTSTISGESLSTVEYTCNAHRATSNTTNVVHDQGRTMYRVEDAFQYILNYLSDNRITFVSSLLSTNVSNLLPPTFNHAILFTNPTVDLVSTHPQPNVEIDYTNGFGETFTLTVAKQATVAATLDRITAAFNNNTSTGDSKEKRYYTQDWRYYAKVTNDGSTQVDMVTYLKGFLVTAVRFAGAVPSTPLTSLEDEFGALSLCTGSQLRGVDLMKATLTSDFVDVTVDKVPELSFDELFANINKAFNIGMTLGYVSGVLTMSLERLSYFFADTQSVSLTSVDNLKVRKAEQYAYNSVSVGDASKNRANIGTQNTSDKWIGSVECFEKELNLKMSFIVDPAQIDYQIKLRPQPFTTALRNAITSPDIYEGLLIYNTDTNQINRAIDNVGGASSWVIAGWDCLEEDDDMDDDIFLIECFDATGTGVTLRTSYFEHRMYYDSAGTFDHTTQYWSYNANLVNYNRIHSWMSLITNDMKLDDYTLTNDDTQLLTHEYEFEHYLSCENGNSIESNPTYFIRFNTGTNSTTGRAGWIEEVSRNNTTGRTNFKLIGKI